MPIPDATLDTITPEQWRGMTTRERQDFTNGWARKGHWSHVCLCCGFPTVYGQATCEACTDAEKDAFSSRLLRFGQGGC